MVRLKAGTEKERHLKQVCLNPTMVRLKANSACYGLLTNRHCLNPTMVRLKVDNQLEGLQAITGLNPTMVRLKAMLHNLEI